MSVVTLPTSKTLPLASLERRSSTIIRSDIDRLEQERDVGNDRLTALKASYDADIMAGDAAAEANETETATTRRSVRRAELRLVELRVELDAAVEVEREDAAQAKRDAANAAVKDLLAKLDKGYRKPAMIIAGFLNEWNAVTELASEAGVPMPHTLSRVKAGYYEPAYDREVTVYIDENGNETSLAYPPGSYGTDAQGRKLDPHSQRAGALLPERPKRTKVERVPQKYVPEVDMGGLPTRVSLPGAGFGEDRIW